MLRHSCGFALANMGIDTRLIQDYLGHRNIRHTVWYTASNAGRFTASGIEPGTTASRCFIEIVEIPWMVLKLHYSYDISKMINHLLIDVIVSVILNYHNKH